MWSTLLVFFYQHGNFILNKLFKPIGLGANCTECNVKPTSQKGPCFVSMANKTAILKSISFFCLKAHHSKRFLELRDGSFSEYTGNGITLQTHRLWAIVRLVRKEPGIVR